MRKFKVWGKPHCWLARSRYVVGNGLSLMIQNQEDGLVAMVTANLVGYDISDYEAFLDVHNFPLGAKLVELLGIGEATGFFGHGGRRTYPLYKFDKKKLDELPSVG